MDSVQIDTTTDNGKQEEYIWPEQGKYEEKFRPTNQQIENVIANCRTLMDPENKLPVGDLFKMVEEFESNRQLVGLFMINTCELGLRDIDDDFEKKFILRNSADYFSQLPLDDIRLRKVSKSILACVMCPLLLKESAAFLTVWSDIIEYTTLAIESKQNEENFPLCLAGLCL